MKKGKSITLLSIIGVIMASLLVITFLRFPFGWFHYTPLQGKEYRFLVKKQKFHFCLGATHARTDARTRKKVFFTVLRAKD